MFYVWYGSVLVAALLLGIKSHFRNIKLLFLFLIPMGFERAAMLAFYLTIMTLSCTVSGVSAIKAEFLLLLESHISILEQYGFQNVVLFRRGMEFILQYLPRFFYSCVLKNLSLKFKSDLLHFIFGAKKMSFESKRIFLTN